MTLAPSVRLSFCLPSHVKPKLCGWRKLSSTWRRSLTNDSTSSRELSVKWNLHSDECDAVSPVTPRHGDPGRGVLGRWISLEVLYLILVTQNKSRAHCRLGGNVVYFLLEQYKWNFQIFTKDKRTACRSGLPIIARSPGNWVRDWALHSTRSTIRRVATEASEEESLLIQVSQCSRRIDFELRYAITEQDLIHSSSSTPLRLMSPWVGLLSLWSSAF
jgi:hypothetical protein